MCFLRAFDLDTEVKTVGHHYHTEEEGQKSERNLSLLCFACL